MSLYPVIGSGGKIYLADTRGFSCNEHHRLQLQERIDGGVPPPGLESIERGCTHRDYTWNAGAYRVPYESGPARKSQRRR
ncbi:MAG: hypothetical protein IPK50_14420 [Fibrobacterota bacterium]|nr:hypothetical protein [Fibrobacterota bacterium]QQS03491.1 MAG: hypothetical protein IPK50_14420 [Fibrobacterota bacterium]